MIDLKRCCENCSHWEPYDIAPRIGQCQFPVELPAIWPAAYLNRDGTPYYWSLTGEGHGDNVCFAKTEKELTEQDGNYYENEIYTQRHLPKWVYRGAEYTLVVVDTNTDGNQLLSVFANSKERAHIACT